jgi:predicted DCC family thiol-disulfide oxidoreductase YuxK
MIQWLDRYWFGEGSLTHLALLRIMVVGTEVLLFYPTLAYQLDLLAVPADEYLPIPALKVLLLPLGDWGIRPDPTLVTAIWLVGLIAGIAGLVGKYAPLSLLTFAFAVTFLTAHSYSYGQGHHPEALTAICLWALALGPSARRWSWDDLQWRVRRAYENRRFEPLRPSDDRSTLARWPLLLVQWLLVLAYFSGAASKLINGGLAWLQSSTLSFYLVQDGLRWERPLGILLAGFPTLVTALAITTVVFEGTFLLAILVPRITWVYLVVGAGMHIGILVTMAAPFLQWVVLYTAFLPTLSTNFPGSWIRARIAAPRKWAIIFDGRCPLCIRSMVFLDYADARKNLEFVDLEADWGRVGSLAPDLTRERALHVMHVVTPEGAVLGGFFAFKELTRALPLLWPLALLTHAPLADRIGPKVYQFVADRRGREPCGAEGCLVRASEAPAG